MAAGSSTTWLEVFGPAFEADAQLAENAARLWHELLGQIEGGPDGLRDARECLQSAIRFAFNTQTLSGFAVIGSSRHSIAVTIW